MKSAAIFALCVAAVKGDEVPGPIGKVLQMIGDLEQKIVAEGEVSQKAYEEHSEFCEDRNKELSFEVKTGKSSVEDLTSTIDKAAADIEELDAKVGDLAASSAEAEKDLKAATSLRQKERAEFEVVEKDLADTVDTISRASGIIEKEMAKGGSFAQLSGAQGLVSALTSLVTASEIGSADASKLTALVQSYSSDKEEDEDESASAPAAAAYESKSGGILDALADLQGKAEDELAASRKAEAKAQNNYDLKKQALEDELKFSGKDMEDAKKSMSANAEKKSEAEGELANVKKDLAEDEKTLAALHADCMSKASDFEAETTSRGEELKALATAKKIIKEATSLTQVSFLQTSQQSSALEAVKIVRGVAFTQRSKSLARLAARIETFAKSNANPFKKVMEMLNSMIAKLEKEAEEEAAQKAFCDKSLGEANAKKEAATTAIDKLNVKIEQGVAKSTKLKEEVVVLQSELAKAMSAQQEMDAIRKKENAIYVEEEAELSKGLKGIQTALKVLRDYYASGDGAQGAGGGIISLLEVCESDISKELAEITASEEDAQANYDAETKENAIAKAAKDQDVKYKQKEIASLEKAGTEHDADLSSVQEELDAVNEGLASLEKQCIGKAESYGEKVAKQKAEIDGLKSALSSLGGASLMQTSRHSQLRGA
jgi:DNA repair exonuclease SbcCD ATPase subunit